MISRHVWGFFHLSLVNCTTSVHVDVVNNNGYACLVYSVLSINKVCAVSSTAIFHPKDKVPEWPYTNKDSVFQKAKSIHWSVATFKKHAFCKRLHYEIKYYCLCAENFSLAAITRRLCKNISEGNFFYTSDCRFVINKPTLIGKELYLFPSAILWLLLIPNFLISNRNVNFVISRCREGKLLKVY